MSNGTINKFELLLKMDELGIDCDIAGGYPRDLEHGKEPKDVDIVAIGDGTKILLLEQWLSSNRLMAAPMAWNNESEYNDDRITCVIKVKSDIPIDIIFWNGDDYTDVDDIIINGFDFNINQYICDDDGQFFLGDREGTLVQIREGVSKDRLEKVTNYARQLGWIVNSKE